LRVEKEARTRTRQELEELKRVVAGMSGLKPIVERASDRLLPTVPSTGTVAVKTTDTDTPEPSVSVEGGRSATNQPTEVESASPIAKRVRNDPRTRHPSILQTFPYVNPVTHVTNQESVQDVLRMNRMRSPRQQRWKGTTEAAW